MLTGSCLPNLLPPPKPSANSLLTLPPFAPNMISEAGPPSNYHSTDVASAAASITLPACVPSPNCLTGLDQPWTPFAKVIRLDRLTRVAGAEEMDMAVVTDVAEIATVGVGVEEIKPYAWNTIPTIL